MPASNHDTCFAMSCAERVPPDRSSQSSGPDVHAMAVSRSALRTAATHVSSSREIKAGFCTLRAEFEAAWQKLTAATDWNQLAQHSQHQSDDQISAFLSQTDLCNAAQTCYHSEDCNVRDAFPPEGVMDFVVEQAGAGCDASAKQLMQGAFGRGEFAWYS